MSDTTSAETNLPLPQFYARTLFSLLPIFDDSVSISDPSTQSQLQRATDELYLVSRMLTSLGVFADNETVDELGDRELVFMTAPWVLGEAESRGGLGGAAQRTAALKRSETGYNAFLSLLTTYEVLGQAGSSSAAPTGSLPADPAKRREAKIQQYRREKELRERISASLPDHPPASSSPVEFVIALLPSSKPAASTSVNEEEGETRNVALLVLQLLHTLTLSALANTSLELDLLASAPSEPVEGPLADPRAVRTEDDDTTWRLDRTVAGSVRPRELISGGGRVLRPFTILPSTSALSDRERLRSEVFRSSHRLPTMTIDEYLEEEQRRGNIITGGGQASYDAPTESELLELAAEDDGTIAAEEAEEKKRLKEEKWAQYTDENRRGEGNTMNRG